MLKTETLKKTEKIASAAYLITGFFDDKEPLKWKLRMLSSRLVSVSISLRDNIELREENIVSQMQKYILEISALFTVAKNAGLVSDMNYTVLIRELDKLSGTLEVGNIREPASGPILSEEFFYIPKNLKAPEELSRNADIKDKEEIGSQNLKDRTIYSREYLPSIEAVDKVRKESAGSPKPQLRPHRDNNLKEFGAVAVKKNSRQSVIINLLKRKKEIMIKDVSPLIEGVSEKTIQRELLSMVGQGILRKEGEKRWSRYSLAQ